VSNEICHTCGQQIPEGYVPVQEASAIARAIRVWGESVFGGSWSDVGETYSFYLEHPDDYPGYDGEDWEVPGILGRVKQVDSYGGVDKGSDRGIVLKVSAPSGERYFVIPGNHQSHYGTDWYPDRIHEVAMHKIEKTEWRAVS
jgi:hypothetical protein